MAVYGVECCPYLGARGDLSSYNPYPVDEAVCLALPQPKGISVKHQQQFCLVASYSLCPRLNKTGRGNGASLLLMSHIPLWVTVGVIFLTVGIAWGILGLIDRSGRDVPGRAVQVSDAEWEKAARAGQGNVQVGQLTNEATTGGVRPPAVVQVATPQATPTAPSARSTPVASAVTSTPVGVKHHEVQPGETLSSIARLYGVTVDALTASNGMRKDDILRAGARLIVPVSGSVYVVQAGDTLTGIAQKYGTSLDDLAAANGIARTANILVGQHLVIPPR